MLGTEIGGNTVQAWGVSFLIIVVAVLVVRLLSRLCKHILRRFVAGTRTRVDDVVLYALESPVELALILLGIWIALRRLVFPDAMEQVVDGAYRILIVLNITWLLARLSGDLLQNYWKRNAGGQAGKMMPVVRRSVLVLVWIIGLVMALSNVGVNISALLGTLGIGGIAFALAAQDTVKNVFGAFTILTDKPFVIGDVICIDGYEGTVVDIGVRSTRLLSYDKRMISLPNYKVTDATIVNVTSEPMRRVVLRLGVTYNTSPAQMQEALAMLCALPKQVENVSDDPQDVQAYFSEYDDSALVITFIYFIRKGATVLKVTSDMNLAILAAFGKAGLEFAFPTHTLYVQQT